MSPDSVDIAASLFEYSGELGDTNALYTFGQLLRTGMHMPRHSIVLSWMPSILSSLKLTLCNILGQGVTPDSPRAANIFTDLAMKGHPYAQVINR